MELGISPAGGKASLREIWAILGRSKTVGQIKKVMSSDPPKVGVGASDKHVLKKKSFGVLPRTGILPPTKKAFHRCPGRLVRMKVLNMILE